MTIPFETFEVIEGTDRFEIHLRCLRCEGGLVVSLLGGELPHVGGVVLATPRIPTQGNERQEDVWDIPAPGHLDTEAALPIARALCRQSGLPVTVTAGIHIAGATKADIDRLLHNCTQALAQLLELLNTGVVNDENTKR